MRRKGADADVSAVGGIGITAGENMYQDDTDIPFIGRCYGRAVREMMDRTARPGFSADPAYAEYPIRQHHEDL